MNVGWIIGLGLIVLAAVFGILQWFAWWWPQVEAGVVGR